MYPSIVIPAGTILYSGGRTPNVNGCPDFYKYIGQGNVESDGMILYLTTNETIAEGYAINDTKNKGVVKKYKTKIDTPLFDITADYLHYDFDELSEFCDITHAGYYLNWGGENNIEIAMCSAPKHVDYLESKRRVGKNQFTEYGCQRGGTKKISRKIVYNARIKNIKAKTRKMRIKAVSTRMRTRHRSHSSRHNRRIRRQING